jgi:hypothetical protein
MLPNDMPVALQYCAIGSSARINDSGRMVKGKSPSEGTRIVSEALGRSTGGEAHANAPERLAEEA